MARNVPNNLTQYQKDFIKKLDQVSRNEGHNRADVFRIFLEMGYYAIKKTTCTPVQAEECETEYMRAVERLRRKKSESATLLSECLGIVVLALEDHLHDFLGPIFMETVSDPAKGQFFTPDALTYVMAQMTMSDLIGQLEREPYLTGQEPAGGTGGAVIAACQYLKDQEIGFSTKMIWQVIELDRNAYMGCYIQLSMAGINAQVVNGNTLTLETFDVAVTPVRMMHPLPFSRPEKRVHVRKRERPKKKVIRKRKRPAKIT